MTEFPALTALHTKALDRLKEVEAGRGPDGFGALLEVARYMAISEVCAAIRKDFRSAAEVETKP
jgi:hypothetical protein